MLWAVKGAVSKREHTLPLNEAEEGERGGRKGDRNGNEKEEVINWHVFRRVS